ncbi:MULTISPECIES: DsbE family thiol:disulfide interchange protein [unclassified Beijerinckia]|uniref:DsbE family thiol:disulfide interchange protein n=1 Tax=unclassified Beijerinckia TaxID=2638183 RepID=UPI0008956BE8|nr:MULTISPECIES: DsbE family thiol:disulfide interchange protein [unclassified Beijerinckia]MDH7798226.1 cytochrome c biogenesis protein CcmG/thiol:disulfide interchange protein DsbE [Beijerinckia sp. GAS462]SED13541.1 cytochrome c biogenesis protein CcmG, thiol:disulfide interchange protein DsbE [Beijerinckia sp. 28-YEA-48]
MTDQAKSETGQSSRRLLTLIPLAAFLALALLFFFRLGAGDASRVPSALIGKQVPAFSLPPVEGTNRPGFSDADLRQGHVSIVNIFASWCVPCRDEHPLLSQLAADAALSAKGVRLIGLNYKDEPVNAARFLNELGNPYALIGSDKPGRAAIDWGVYGVPETFVVKGDGTIAFKVVGPLSETSLRTVLLPEIEKALR